MSRSVWFVIEVQEGVIHPGAAELASAAAAVGEEVTAVVCAAPGSAVIEVAAGLADHVLALENDLFREVNAEAWATAIVEQARSRGPAAILLPHAPLGRDVGPLLAARLGSGMISDCTSLEWDRGLVGERSVYFRKLLSRERVVADGPAIATCQRGAFASRPVGAAGAVERVTVQLEGSALRTRVSGYERAEIGEEDITEAEIVVAGGRGLGDAEKFTLVSELAAAVGGVMAASRPVVDQGWVGHDRQVGSSGTTVRPRLYIALGISGAIQHIVGMRESDVIVAINKDSQAPIFEYAHYGIVDDLFKVVPAMISALT